MNLQEYVKNEEHLSEQGKSYLEMLADEYGVKASDLWIDILAKNKLRFVLEVETYEEFKELLTKYKPDTAFNRLNDTMQTLKQVTGMTKDSPYGSWGNYVQPPRKKKKVWTGKKYEWR